MKNKRKQLLNEALEKMCDYLEDSGWKLDQSLLLWTDPKGFGLHRTDFAFVIQSDRDMFSKLKVKF